MKSVSLVTAVLAVIPMIGVAQTKQVGPSLSCVKDFTYSREFLAKYPRAGAACTRVVEKNGQKWVRFAAQVVRVNGNHVVADFLDRFGNKVGTVTIQPSPDQRVLVRGHEMRYSLLKPGEQLAFWMPQNQIGFYAAPDASDTTHLAVVTMRFWGKPRRF